MNSQKEKKLELKGSPKKTPNRIAKKDEVQQRSELSKGFDALGKTLEKMKYMLKPSASDSDLADVNLARIKQLSKYHGQLKDMDFHQQKDSMGRTGKTLVYHAKTVASPSLQSKMEDSGLPKSSMDKNNLEDFKSSIKLMLTKVLIDPEVSEEQNPTKDISDYQDNHVNILLDQSETETLSSFRISSMDESDIHSLDSSVINKYFTTEERATKSHSSPSIRSGSPSSAKSSCGKTSKVIKRKPLNSVSASASDSSQYCKEKTSNSQEGKALDFVANNVKQSDLPERPSNSSQRRRRADKSSEISKLCDSLLGIKKDLLLTDGYLASALERTNRLVAKSSATSLSSCDLSKPKRKLEKLPDPEAERKALPCPERKEILKRPPRYGNGAATALDRKKNFPDLEPGPIADGLNEAGNTIGDLKYELDHLYDSHRRSLEKIIHVQERFSEIDRAINETLSHAKLQVRKNRKFIKKMKLFCLKRSIRNCSYCGNL